MVRRPQSWCRFQWVARADRWVNARREELVASGELFVDLPESR